MSILIDKIKALIADGTFTTGWNRRGDGGDYYHDATGIMLPSGPTTRKYIFINYVYVGLDRDTYMQLYRLAEACVEIKVLKWLERRLSDG